MFKKSLLSLLVISTFAVAAEEPKTKHFTEAEVKNQIAQAKTVWQNERKALLKQRENFLALENMLNTASKQKLISTPTVELANKLVATLEGYPLQMEAEAALIKYKFDMGWATREADLAKFVEKYPRSTYAKQLAQLLFEPLFKQQQFTELLEYSKKIPPESVQNQCRVFAAYYDNLLKTEESVQANSAPANSAKETNALQDKKVGFHKAEFFKEFQAFWLKTPQLPAECETVMAAFQPTITHTDIANKAVNLFEKNAKLPLQQLITKEDNELNRWLKAVESLMNDPKKLDSFIQTQAKSEHTKQIAQKAFAKWVKTLPEEMANPSFAPIQQWADKLALNGAEQREWKIAYLNRLFDNPNIPFQLWRDSQIAELKADNLTERRLRLAIGQQAETASWLALLSDEGKAKSEWRYWAAKNEKDEAKRKVRLSELSKERGFYPMLAAQQLGQNYQFKAYAYSPLTEEQIRKFSAEFDRLQELRELQRFQQARLEIGEWFKTLSAEEKLAITDELFKRDWYDLAVEGTIQAKAFNYINLRLPDAYSDWFKMNLTAYKISKTFAQAIARQESAWNAQAKSHANAMGLMQMLPSTATKTAQANGLPFAGENDLFQPFNNIMLGTTHLAELNAKYPENRALIAAAYNAGASRVDKWLARAGGKLQFDEFVASIPFFETRGYVQNVLAYDYYYQLLQKVANPTMFKPEELERKY